MPSSKKPQRKKGKNLFLELRDRTKNSKETKKRSFTYLYFIIAFIAIIVINSYISSGEVRTIPYSDFKQWVA